MSANGDTMQIRTPQDLGHAIRERRKQLELDQRELARRVGVSRQWVVEIERGKPRAEVGLILRVLRELGLHLQTLPASGSAEPKVIKPSSTKARVAVPDLDALIERARGTRS